MDNTQFDDIEWLTRKGQFTTDSDTILSAIEYVIGPQGDDRQLFMLTGRGTQVLDLRMDTRHDYLLAKPDASEPRRGLFIGEKCVGLYSQMPPLEAKVIKAWEFNVFGTYSGGALVFQNGIIHLSNGDRPFNKFGGGKFRTETGQQFERDVYSQIINGGGGIDDKILLSLVKEKLLGSLYRAGILKEEAFRETGTG